MATSRLRKWILGILSGLIGLILIVFLVAYIVAITHRKEIVEFVTGTFNEKLSGKLTIKDVDFTAFDGFPSFTTRIEGVVVYDSASAVRGDTVFRAGRISVRLHVLQLITGKIHINTIKISDAYAYLVKDLNGRMNTPQSRNAKQQAQQTEQKELSLPSVKRIYLDNVSFRMVDSVKNKSFSFRFIKGKFTSLAADSGFAYLMEGNLHFDGLVFNPVKGGYLTDQDVKIKTALAFNLQKKVLRVYDGTLFIKEQKLLMKARMDFANMTMKMQFDTKSILPSVAYGVLTPAISEKLNAYQLEKPVKASVEISGSIKPGSKPAADVYFKTADNKLPVGKKSFDNLELLGWFTNHIDSTKINDDHNSRVALPIFRGTVYGLPIDAKVIVTDLLEPTLYMKANVIYDEQKQGEITTQRFKFQSGNININFVFDGPLTNYVDSANRMMRGDVSGGVSIKDASLTQLSTGYEFTKVNGHISFKKPDVFIDSIRMTANGNVIKLSGTASRFIAFLFVPGVKAQANLDLWAETLDFNAFKRPPAPKEKPVEKKPKNKNAVGDLIDYITESVEFDINLSANKVLYKNFTATVIKAAVVLDSDYLKITNAGMSTSGGSFLLNMSVTKLSAPQHAFTARASVKGVRMNELMYSFDNFGQKTITDKNIFGTVTATANVSAMLDENYNVIGSSMRGVASTRVKNGSLKDLEGFEKITKYIFKNRDFSNIEFRDIDNHAVLTGSVVDIDTLDIYSSVITLFVNGKYDFNKTNTDLLVTIPFSNLKKMDASERMALSDSAAKRGGNLVLRVSNGDDGNMKIAPVVFDKKKKKEKS